MARRKKKDQGTKAPSSRYHDEMTEIILKKFEEADGGISTGALRDQLMEELDDSFLTNWLWEQGPTLLAREILNVLQHERQRARQRAKTAAYGDAVSRATDGDEEARSIFQTRYFLENGNSYPLGALRGSDHHLIAESYDKRGSKFLLYAELHTQLARRVGTKRTDEVFSEDELTKLMGKFEYDPKVEATRAA